MWKGLFCSAGKRSPLLTFISTVPCLPLPFFTYPTDPKGHPSWTHSFSSHSCPPHSSPTHPGKQNRLSLSNTRVRPRYQRPRAIYNLVALPVPEPRRSSTFALHTLSHLDSIETKPGCTPPPRRKLFSLVATRLPYLYLPTLTLVEPLPFPVSSLGLNMRLTWPTNQPTLPSVSLSGEHAPTTTRPTRPLTMRPKLPTKAPRC